LPGGMERPVRALFPRSRRIGRSGDIGIEKPFVAGVAGAVTISVRCVGGRALSRAVFDARRLGVLPNNSVWRGALRQSGGSLRKNAAGCGRADVIEDPQS
jgi:hypothetical protein